MAPLIPKAPRLLAVDERGALYFHLLRLGICPKLADERERAILEEAFRRVLPLLTVSHPSFRLARTQGLFVFARDDRGPLANQSTLTLALYQHNVATWRYLSSFSHMPGMLAKRRKFVELAGDRRVLERVRDVLMRMRLQGDLPGAACLWFWALVYVALQDDDAAKDVVSHVVKETMSEDFTAVRSTLIRYLEASDRPALAAAVGG